MTSTGLRRLARLYCLLAGTCDAITGLLLVIAPLTTLGLMRIATMPAEPVYLRFIGAFVGGVGLLYLYPFLFSDRARVERTLAVVLEATALVRLGVAAFVGWAIAEGDLSIGWISVAFTDLGFAGLQIAIVRRRILPGPLAGEGADR